MRRRREPARHRRRWPVEPIQHAPKQPLPPARAARGGERSRGCGGQVRLSLVFCASPWRADAPGFSLCGGARLGGVPRCVGGVSSSRAGDERRCTAAAPCWRRTPIPCGPGGGRAARATSTLKAEARFRQQMLLLHSGAALHASRAAARRGRACGVSLLRPGAASRRQASRHDAQGASDTPRRPRRSERRTRGACTSDSVAPSRRRRSRAPALCTTWCL